MRSACCYGPGGWTPLCSPFAAMASSGAYGAATPAGGWKNASAPATPYETVRETVIGTPGAAAPRRAVESPSGLTPPAKRPADRASIQIAEIGERVMSVEVLSSGFHQLLRRISGFEFSL